MYCNVVLYVATTARERYIYILNKLNVKEKKTTETNETQHNDLAKRNLMLYVDLYDAMALECFAMAFDT